VIENEFGAVPIDNELLANSVPILQGLGSVGIGLVMGWAHIYIYLLPPKPSIFRVEEKNICFFKKT